MKTLLLFLFSLLIFTPSKAQTYYPFPTNTGYWSSQNLDDFYQPTNGFYVFRLDGDTTINLFPYKKLQSKCYGNIMYNICGYLGALREDNKIIYFVPKDSINEVVLYNFNLQLGDTVLYPYSFWNPDMANDTFIVSNIDSVLCADGNYHRQFKIGQATIIEGVGSTKGPTIIQYQFAVSGLPRLNCSSNDNGIVYSESNTTCFTNVEETANNEKTISIFPNPSNTLINIYAQSKITSMQIINTLGQICYATTLNATPATVDISQLPKGVYFARMVINNLPYTQKIIITD